MRSPPLLIPILTLGVVTSAPADTPEARPVAPDDAFTLDTVAGMAVDTRGTKVAFILRRWSEDDDGTVRDLWLLDTRSRNTRRLTFTDDLVAKPTFSPNGDTLYMVAKDDQGDKQLFRIDADGGPMQPLTREPGGIDGYELDPSGKAAWIVVHTERPASDDWAGLRSEHADLTYVDRQVTTSRVDRLDLATFRTDTVWTPDAYIIDLEVTRHGERLAAITAPDVELIRWEGETEVVIFEPDTDSTSTLDDALWRDNAPSPYGWLSSLAWASDGRALAFRVDFDGHPGEVFAAELAGGEAEVWKLPRPREVHVDSPGLRWVPGRRELCFGAAEKARRRVVCLDRVRSGTVGRDRTVPSGDAVVEDFAFSGDGRDLIAYAGTPDRFPELYRLPARGTLAAVPLTDLNPHTKSWALPSLSIVQWTAPDGTAVEGVLELPAGWTPEDGPLPTMVVIHGGPTSQSRYQRRFRYHGRTLLASQGHAVFLPNYRGSTGYGDAFLTDLIGKEADIEVVDILAGVDHLVSEGISDADRLAVGGWSNGGFLTNAIVSRSDRFKAAISGAGVADQTMQWALEDTPGHVINYMQGLPWEQNEAHETASPLRALGGASIPTLIHVGENDARVPAAHARAMFRALDVYLDVPTELVIYPDTGHGLRKMSHQQAKMAWDLAWLARWLNPEAPAAPTATADEDEGESEDETGEGETGEGEDS